MEAEADDSSRLIATSSPHIVIDDIGPRIDELTRAIAESNLADKTGVNPPSYDDSNTEGLRLHTVQLRNFAQEILSRSEPLTSKSIDSDDDLESQSDSDDEFEAKLALKSLHRGIELCRARKYREAEPTLKNALKSARLAKLARSKAEDLKFAEVKLAEAYLYQENWSEAEEALSTITESNSSSKSDDTTLADAYYLRAQLCLTKHDFGRAQKFCRKAMRVQKRLGKTHASYYQSLVLLALVFETSGDKETAAEYLEGVPLQYLDDRKHLACARFSSEGSCLSNEQETRSYEILEKEFGPVDCRYQDPQESAMRWAAAKGYKELVQLLIWKGTKVDATTSAGETPLMSAISSSKEDVISLLLEKGAKIEQNDHHGQTPLLRAAFHGNENVIRLLLRHGAKVDVVDYSGSNVVLEASFYGHVHAVSIFIKEGVDVNLANSDRRTALMFAAKRDHLETVSLLLNAGADVNRIDKIGCTALTRAAEYHHHDIVKLLINAGASLDVLDYDKCTPLIRVATAFDTSSLRFLIAQGADVNIGGDGRTALWSSVNVGLIEAVRILLENGADPNSYDVSNDPPLLVASRSGYTEIAKLLLDHGANLDPRIDYCESVLSANRGWNHETVELLKAYGAKK